MFVISFTYTDKFKAQAVVRALVRKFAAYGGTSGQSGLMVQGDPLQGSRTNLPHIDVLDPASLMELPVAPARGVIAGLGTLAGLAFGGLAMRKKLRVEKRFA